MINGTKKWFTHGKLNREDGPAVVWSDGSEAWYKHDKLHRIGGPAKTKPDGSKEWWQEGQLHRLDGPAIERPSAPVGVKWMHPIHYIHGIPYYKDKYDQEVHKYKQNAI
jgi:hypothetical protein